MKPPTAPTKSENAGWAYVALGSNLGQPTHIVQQAMAQLQQLSPGPLLRSSLWRSDPVDCPPGSPAFVNAVAGFQVWPTETPESLLANLQRIEVAFGRRPKTVLNEPRHLDLDLIAFGQAQLSTAALVLPHPRAHRRRFVLQPLAEIAPNLVLPGQSSSVSALLAALPPGERVTKLRPP